MKKIITLFLLVSLLTTPFSAQAQSIESLQAVVFNLQNLIQSLLAGISAGNNLAQVTSPSPSVTFSASPSTITLGESSTLSWSSANATSCILDIGASKNLTQPTSGSYVVTPSKTMLYVIKCTGPVGSDLQSLSVTVNPAGSTGQTSTQINTTSATTQQTTTVAPTTVTATVSPTTVSTITPAALTNVSGVVATPILPTIFSTPMPVQTGKVWVIPGGDSAGFQQALNSASLGDTIELQAGATYNGAFTFPKKTQGSGWIVVRSSAHANLPQSGIRVSPADAVNMPKLVSPGGNSPTIEFAQGAHRYRLIGLDVTLPTTLSYTHNTIVRIRPNSGNVADLPNNITFDRTYIHAQPTNDLQRCVQADGAYIAIVDSYLSECHAKGFDSQAIAAWDSNGPLKIVNNHLEGAGENVMFGGADPLILGAIPSDIEIRGNYFYTPIAWKGTGGTTLWTKKNLFETKAGKRILVEGNIFDGSWTDGQVGHALLFKSTNPGGRCTWCQTTDVTVRYNIIRNVGGTTSVIGNSGSSNTNPIGGRSSRFLFEHNIFENINVAPYTGVARLIELYNDAQDVAYRNNTWNTTGYIQHFISGGTAPTATNFEYKDNIAPFGQYGLVPGYSEATFSAVVNGVYNYSGDVVYTTNTTAASKYPNTQFVKDYASALATGKGANQSAVLAATKYALTGGGTSTPPPPPPPPPSTPTLTLTASPTAITSGQSSTLTWSSSNVTSCTASGGWTGTKATSGTQTVAPTANSTYTLTCTGTGGTTSQSATVNVGNITTPTITLSASPTTITSGQSSTITWSSTNTTSCTASGGWTGTKATSGTQTVTPTANTTYTLGCTGTGGSASQNVTVLVSSSNNKFIIGDTVQTTSNLNVRSAAAGTILGTQPLGAIGAVVGGPVTGSDAIWWNVNYVNAPDGWSAESFLTKTTAPPPVTTAGLQSSLDSLTAITNPTIGTGVGASVVTSPLNDFTTGKMGNGVRLNSPSEYIRFQQTDGTKRNVELDQGTIDLWFQPLYNHDDNNKYRIFSNGEWGTHGAIGVGKHNSSNNNAFYLHRFDSAGNLDAINTIDVSKYNWRANDWVNLRVTWNWKAAPGVQNIRVYFNGVEAQVSGDNGKPVTTGTWSVGSESANNYVYIGNVGPNGSLDGGITNNAVFDEVRIWDTVIPATPPPPSTPTLTLTASPTAITSGQSSTLTWSSSNVTSCTASGGWTGTKATSGTQTVAPTANSTYTLTCTGSSGSVTQSATVSVGTVPPPPTGKFIIGDTVQTTSNLNVRSAAAGTILGTQPLGAIGAVVGGPVTGSDAIWWNVNYVNAPDGWSAESFLTKTTAPPPPPPVTGITIGSIVQVIDNVNVRDEPSGRRLGKQEAGAQGVVRGGGTTSKGFTWWDVDFTKAPDGFVAGAYLLKIK